MLQVVQFPQAVEEGERELNFQVAPHVIIAIPAYNEERFIGSMVLQCLHYTDHVVVIDDGSNDATAAIAEQAGATVLRQDYTHRLIVTSIYVGWLAIK